jgi:hypothetical protein
MSMSNKEEDDKEKMALKGGDPKPFYKDINCRC